MRALAVALLLLAAPSAFAQTGGLVPRQHLAPSGLRTWQFPSSDPGRFSLVVLIDAGSRDEEPGRSGVAHLLEHCLFRATSHRSTQELLEGLRDHRVEYDGSTSTELTTFQFDAPAADWQWVVQAAGDLIATPALAEGDVAAERAIVLEELGGDSPDAQESTVEMEIYPGHPLGDDPGGAPSDVERLTRADVAAFHARAYRAGSVVVAWAAGEAGAAVDDAISGAFSALPAGNFDHAREPPGARTGAWLFEDDAPGSTESGGDDEGDLIAGHHVAPRRPETFAAMMVLERALYDACFRAMRTDKPLAYFLDVEFVPLTDAWRLQFEAHVRHRAALSDVSEALALATRRTQALDAAEFEASRDAAMQTLSAGDSVALADAAVSVWSFARAGAADADLGTALRTLTLERTREIARASLGQQDAFTISNDASLRKGPSAGWRALAGVVAVITLALALALGIRRLQRSRLEGGHGKR